MTSRLEMEDIYGHVCDCDPRDSEDNLCGWCRDMRKEELLEQKEDEMISELEQKIEQLEKHLLAKSGENAELKMKNAELQVEVSTLRGYADRVECHLRDAKANIVLLMSKVQESEAREY